MKGKDYVDYSGRMFATKKAMCEYHGVSYQLYNHRIKNGMAQRDALKPPFGRKRERKSIPFRWSDGMGNVFDTMYEMCMFHNITERAYKKRIENGWDLEKALTTPVKRKSLRPCTDHLGRTSDSVEQMCQKYGISSHAYHDRMKRGWTMKDALTIPAGGKRANRKKCTDHFGRSFDSKTAMCRKYGIGLGLYGRRMASGWNKREALTTPVKHTACTDHRGNVYASVAEMCRMYGVTPQVYRRRIAFGWDQEKALTTPVRQTACTDHLGNRFGSEARMCRKYGITPQAYRNRMASGWDQKKALKTPIEKQTYVDPYGHEYASMADMCRHFRISPVSYGYRIRKGWDQKKALITPVRKMTFAGFAVKKFSYEIKETPLYQCTCKECGYSEILSYDEMEEHERRHAG